MGAQEKEKRGRGRRFKITQERENGTKDERKNPVSVQETEKVCI